jgi:hypothetical protein
MSTGMPESEAEILTENIRLHARVEALEAELAGARARQSQPQSETDRLRIDTTNDVAEEACHVFHAVTHAFVEQLRASADVIDAVADEVWRRRKDRNRDAHNRTARPAAMDARPYSRMETLEDLESARVRRLSDDIAAVVNTAVERSLDVPRRVIGALSDSYRHP